MMERSYRMLPNTLYSGFAIISAVYKMISHYPQQCKKLLELFEVEGVDDNKMCVSNWVCKNAETLQFHQETDTSYTMLSVPIWNKEQLEYDGLELGSANFLFRWTHPNCEHKSMYIPIKMDEGITIIFSGYGCYHCQHRTDLSKEFWNLASYKKYKEV